MEIQPIKVETGDGLLAEVTLVTPQVMLSMETEQKIPGPCNPLCTPTACLPGILPLPCHPDCFPKLIPPKPPKPN